MFKKIEALDKVKHKNMRFDEINLQEIAKHMGSIPLGFSEVIEMGYFCPVIISGDPSNLEFVAFSGVNSQISIFLKEGQYIPMYIQAYPFLNAVLVDKKGIRKDVIGIDMESDFINKDGENSVFEKGELTKITQDKINLIRQLNRERDISKKIVRELQRYSLLIEKDFKVIFEETTKIVLENFYIVDREKLIKLDDSVIALWAKKGWTTLIDIHLKSIGNFEKIVRSVQ